MKRRGMSGRWCAVMVLTCCGWIGPAQAGPIANGIFSAGLSSWTVESGTVSDGGGFALFEEHALDLRSSLVQQFTLPADATTLSFDVSMTAQPGGNDLAMAPDAFVATLYDNPTDLNALLSIPGYSEFFYFDNSGVEDASVVTFDGTTVSLDVSSLAGQDVFLAFDLLGGDDGMITIVCLDNVLVPTQPDAVIPAPGALLLALVGTGLHALGTRRSRHRSGGM